jgi:uncharacterized membrane protein
MKRNHLIVPILILVGLLFLNSGFFTVHAQTSEPVVHAVLFYSPSCPHCHQVIQEVLPPLFELYGDQLNIIGVDVSQEGGQLLYQAAIQSFSIPEDRLGVPTMIIGNVILVGSLEIPEQLPGLIEQYLAQGGVDWPDIPKLREALSPTAEVYEPTTTTTSPQPAPLQATPVPTSVSQTSSSPTPTPGLILTGDQNSGWSETLARDPAGNILAIFVLVGMLAAMIWGVALFRNQNGVSLRGKSDRLVPVICVVGLIVAGYLAYVETARVDAVCGPVGDCNTVQQSEYARLFGILPIGALGLVGYIAILITWFIARSRSNLISNLASLAILVMTTSGTFFSIYLTFLEPFVIGATCAWCLTSAILMTVLMLLSVQPAKLAISKISFSSSHHRERKRTGG